MLLLKILHQNNAFCNIIKSWLKVIIKHMKDWFNDYVLIIIRNFTTQLNQKNSTDSCSKCAWLTARLSLRQISHYLAQQWKFRMNNRERKRVQRERKGMKEKDRASERVGKKRRNLCLLIKVSWEPIIFSFQNICIKRSKVLKFF